MAEQLEAFFDKRLPKLNKELQLWGSLTGSVRVRVSSSGAPSHLPALLNRRSRVTAAVSSQMLQRTQIGENEVLECFRNSRRCLKRA